jgi:outer membrane assembly lipoprotein YfgL
MSGGTLRRAPAWLRLASALGVALLVGCSGAEKPDPMPLPPLAAQAEGRVLWRAQVGAPVPTSARVQVHDGLFVVSARGGEVQALDPATGATRWRADFGERLATAAGTDGRWVAAVSADGELIVLEGGKRLWSRRLVSAALTPPLVAGERVFVQTVDRAVEAFDAREGASLWRQQRSGEPLALSQVGVLQAWRDTLLVGIGPRLAGLDPSTGRLRFEATVATPRGTNEVERLADLVGPAVRLGDRLCVRAYQSSIGCVNLERGTAAWTRNAGGVVGLGGDADLLAGADASDRISAWRTAAGEVAWTNELLRHRGLTAPWVGPKLVVFGDAQGWVHGLSRTDGTPRLQLPTDGSPVLGAPVAAGGTVAVLTRDGLLLGLSTD